MDAVLSVSQWYHDLTGQMVLPFLYDQTNDGYIVSLMNLPVYPVWPDYKHSFSSLVMPTKELAEIDCCYKVLDKLQIISEVNDLTEKIQTWYFDLHRRTLTINEYKLDDNYKFQCQIEEGTVVTSQITNDRLASLSSLYYKLDMYIQHYYNLYL